MLLTGDVVRLGTMNGFDASARWLVPKIEEESGVLVSERDRWRVGVFGGYAMMWVRREVMWVVPVMFPRVRTEEEKGEEKDGVEGENRRRHAWAVRCAYVRFRFRWRDRVG